MKSQPKQPKQPKQLKQPPQPPQLSGSVTAELAAMWHTISCAWQSEESPITKEEILRVGLDVILSLLHCRSGRHYWICREDRRSYEEIQEYLCPARCHQAPSRLVAFWQGLDDVQETSRVFEQMVAITVQTTTTDLSSYLSAIFGVVECHKGCLDNGRHLPSSEETAALEQGGVEKRFGSLKRYVEKYD